MGITLIFKKIRYKRRQSTWGEEEEWEKKREQEKVMGG
jgi:hypothetical protein